MLCGKLRYWGIVQRKSITSKKVSGWRNASVGIATVTQESFESQYYITRTPFGMTAAFTCDLYGMTSQDINKARATMFKSGRCSERDLPPNQDSLQKHIQRASYQAAVHRRSLECFPDIPPPINHGWKMGSSTRWTGCHFHRLQRQSLSLFTAPAKKKNCVRGKRTCKVYELPCTNLCKCTNCDNNTLE